MKNKKDLLFAVKQEIVMKSVQWDHQAYASLYFGGGTPSLLEPQEIEEIIEIVKENYRLARNAEITLEANPENLSISYLNSLKNLGINRLSIGIQSFNNRVLEWMNRAHFADQARSSIQWALAAGFSDITVDLIYGHPFLSMQEWERTVEETLASGINHLSCYALTVEQKTALAYWVRNNKVTMPSDDLVASQYELLIDMVEARDWEAYEISNFAHSGAYAVHNSNYWKGVPYLGIGPSAHSYDGGRRYWNISNNANYIKAITEGRLPQKQEILSLADRYNEYLLTSLRTKWGCHENHIKDYFAPFYVNFKEIVDRKLREGLIINIDEDQLVLSRRGKLLADQITADFFIVAEEEESGLIE